jgi:serine/threonine-protein kinase
MDEGHHLTQEEDAFLGIAVAIADGTPIDWSEHDNAVSPSSSSESMALALRLRQLERIVRGHQELGGRVEAEPSLTPLTDLRSALQPASKNSLQVQWGPLIVLEKIGRGSFGDVYRAWDPRLHREVALKLVADNSVATPTFEEGRLLARVRHPNVVTVYGAERVANRVGIWMEYIRGRTLAAEIADRGPVVAREAAQIGVEVCRALSAVHGAGLLHRDVKAQNVMREADGRIVLGDFGTGIHVDENAGITEPQIAGTPLYLAPELLDGHPASTASDLYSLGVLLYFLVTGEYPIRGSTLKDLRRAHAEGCRRSLATVRPDLSSAFVQIVETLISPDPRRRHGNTAAVETALTGWLFADASPMPASSERRHSRMVIPLFAVAIVSVAGFVPGVRAWIRSWGGASLWTVSSPVSRQIPDPPCTGRPTADGQWIACVEDISHLRDRGGVVPPPLVLFSPVTGETTTIRQPPQGDRITSALISPDGAHVAFAVASQGKPVEIRMVNPDGGSERLVTALPMDVSIGLGEWSARQDRILSRLWRKGRPQAAALLSPFSGDLEVIFEYESPPQGFSLSPDGRLLAFDALQSPDGPERDIRVCDLSTRACETVAAHPAIDVQPIWTPDGRLLFNSDRGGTMGLWSVTLSGLRQAAAPELIRDTGRGRMVPQGFGSNGLFFYRLESGDFDIYTATTASATTSEVAPVRLSPRAVDVNRSPVWSPDGQSIAYVSRRGPFAEKGAMRIVIQSQADGRERELRYDIPANMTRLAWSPDGRILAMRTMVGGVFGIHLVDVTNGTILKTLRRRNPPEQYVEDQISDLAWLDRETIVFATRGGIETFDVTSADEQQRWVAPAGTSLQGMSLSPDRLMAAVALADDGSVNARWFSVGAMRFGQPSLKVLTRVNAPEVLWMQAWSADGQAILVTRSDLSAPLSSQRPRLWRVPLDGTPASPLPLALKGLSEVRLRPDGQRMAFTAGGLQSEFWMLTIR